MKYLTSIPNLFTIYSHSYITVRLFKRLLSTNIKENNPSLKSEIPVVKGLPFVGTAFSLLAAGGGQKLHEYIGKRHQEFGSVFREKLGPIDAVWVSDPADIKLLFAQEGKYARHILPEAWLLYNETYGQQRGLYFMDGEEWWTYRKCLNKMMLVDSNKCFIEASSIILQEVLNKWEMFNGLLIENLETDLYRISISFMVSHLVGGVFEGCKEEVSNDINKLAHSVQQIFRSSVKFTILPAKTAKLLKLGIWHDFVNAVDESINNANQLVSKLMEYKGDGLLKSMSTIQDISDNMIKRLVIDFILAAGDTTAYSTQWALYTLGLYPKVQENLRKSLSTTFFWENELLNNILKEVLRLYPLAPFLTRIVPYNTVLTNHIIPANSIVVMSMFSSSRNESYFKNPNDFNPDRWKRFERNKYYGVYEPFATLPYGFGPRSCIGQKLAHIQMCSTISECIKGFKIQTIEPVNIVLDLITVPDAHIKMKIHKIQ